MDVLLKNSASANREVILRIIEVHMVKAINKMTNKQLAEALESGLLTFEVPIKLK